VKAETEERKTEAHEVKNGKNQLKYREASQATGEGVSQGGGLPPEKCPNLCAPSNEARRDARFRHRVKIEDAVSIIGGFTAQ